MQKEQDATIEDAEADFHDGEELNFSHNSLSADKLEVLGDAVTAEVSVERVGRAGRLLDFATRCTNEQGELVLDGSARCLLPAAGEPG